MESLIFDVGDLGVHAVRICGRKCKTSMMVIHVCEESRGVLCCCAATSMPHTFGFRRLSSLVALRSPKQRRGEQIGRKELRFLLYASRVTTDQGQGPTIACMSRRQNTRTIKIKSYRILNTRRVLPAVIASRPTSLSPSCCFSTQTGPIGSNPRIRWRPAHGGRTRSRK